jgi:hypothetical protein
MGCEVSSSANAPTCRTDQYAPANSTNSAAEIEFDKAKQSVIAEQSTSTAHEHTASTQGTQRLAPTYQNGWTYASMPGVTFFEYEPGRYAYTESGSNTLHSVDNKQMSIMLKNGHPVLSKLTCSVYEVPANLLDPNPGEMSSAGTRWNAQGPRQTYQNPKALDLAMAGYWKEAEIWEAGHGCAGCHIERPTNGPVPNEMLDLNQYNRVALMTKVASDVVGSKYDPRNPMTILHMGISHAINSPIPSGNIQETRPADPKAPTPPLPTATDEGGSSPKIVETPPANQNAKLPGNENAPVLSDIEKARVKSATPPSIVERPPANQNATVPGNENAPVLSDIEKARLKNATPPSQQTQAAERPLQATGTGDVARAKVVQSEGGHQPSSNDPVASRGGKPPETKPISGSVQIEDQGAGKPARDGKGTPGSAENRGYVDGTGRFHTHGGTGLPTVQDLRHYSVDELKLLRQELEQSTAARIQNNAWFGHKPSEGERQAAEQALVRAIDKLLQ